MNYNLFFLIIGNLNIPTAEVYLLNKYSLSDNIINSILNILIILYYKYNFNILHAVICDYSVKMNFQPPDV